MKIKGTYLEVWSSAGIGKKIHTHLCTPLSLRKILAQCTWLFSGAGSNGDNGSDGRHRCRNGFKRYSVFKKNYLIMEIILKIDISKWSSNMSRIHQ